MRGVTRNRNEGVGGGMVLAAAVANSTQVLSTGDGAVSAITETDGNVVSALHMRRGSGGSSEVQVTVTQGELAEFIRSYQRDPKKCLTAEGKDSRCKLAVISSGNDLAIRGTLEKGASAIAVVSDECPSHEMEFDADLMMQVGQENEKTVAKMLGKSEAEFNGLAGIPSKMNAAVC